MDLRGGDERGSFGNVCTVKGQYSLVRYREL
jgi:hypothetical protein